MKFSLWYQDKEGFDREEFDDLLEALDRVETLQRPPYEYDRRFMSIEIVCGCR